MYTSFSFSFFFFDVSLQKVIKYSGLSIVFITGPDSPGQFVQPG